MREFTKPIRRSVKIRSSDPTLGTAVWVVQMDVSGLLVRREGARKDTARKLSWRSVIGYAHLWTKTGG